MHLGSHLLVRMPLLLNVIDIELSGVRPHHVIPHMHKRVCAVV